MDLANQSLESKEYEQALLACDNAISIRPDVSIAYRQKAVVLRKLGRFEESVNVFRKSFRASTRDDAVLKKKRDEEVPLCMIRFLCKGAKATRRCNSCGLHDDDYGYVDYCDISTQNLGVRNGVVLCGLQNMVLISNLNRVMLRRT